MERMDGNQHPHRALYCYIEGKRSRGRQRKMQMDNVKEELDKKNLNIRTVTEFAGDRTRWRALVHTYHQLS
jgi:hypothetical protein